MTDFNDPGATSGDSLPLEQNLGNLLMFTVDKITDPIETKFGRNLTNSSSVIRPKFPWGNNPASAQRSPTRLANSQKSPYPRRANSS